jgi:hypothetical protein
MAVDASRVEQAKQNRAGPMTLDRELSSRLLASVEQGFTEQLAFTQEMMRFPSLRVAEHAVQDFVFRVLRARGYPVDRFEMDEAALDRHEGAGAFPSSIRARRLWLAFIGRGKRRVARLFCKPTSMSCPPGQPRCGRTRLSNR